MKIKRFFAKDMRSALAQVKETLGSDAVIMSNKKVTGGIEIVAAIEHQSETTAPVSSAAQEVNGRSLENDSVNLSSQAKGRTRAQESFSALKTNSSAKMGAESFEHLFKRHSSETQGASAQQPKSIFSNGASGKPRAPFASGSRQKSEPVMGNRAPLGAAPADSLAAMQKQIDGIRQLLQHQVSGLMWQEMERREPLRAMLIKRLIRLGFSEDLADQLACFIPESCSEQEAWHHLGGLLTDQLSTGKDEILRLGGVVALMGATGVGKTTTIAKLAAQAVARYGAHQVAMISTDTYRIGAHEQLATYAKIMGCTMKVAQNEEELAEILYQLKEKKLVLIDTAGMSQRDLRLQEQLDTLMRNAQTEIRSYLVLSATAQRMVLEETFEQFKRLPLTGTIVTKLDEALSLGEILSVLLRQALPVSYITNGQRVPEDIDVADAAVLIGYALNHDDEYAPHFWVSEESESAMMERYE